MLNAGGTARVQGEHLGAIVMHFVRRISLHVPSHGRRVNGADHATVGDGDSRSAAALKLGEQGSKTRLNLTRAFAAWALKINTTHRQAIEFLAHLGA